MAVQLLAVSIPIDIPGIEQTKFSSDKSVLGYDLILLDPDTATEEFECEDNSETTTYTLGRWQSMRWWECFDQRRSEFEELLAQDKHIVLFSSSALRIGLRARGDFGDEPKKRLTKTSVTAALPVEIEFETSRGSQIEYTGQLGTPFAEFAMREAQHLEYYGYLISEVSVPLFNVRGSKRVVGATYALEHGRITVLPWPRVRVKEFLDELVNTIDTIGPLTKRRTATPPPYVTLYQTQAETALVAERDSLQRSMEELSRKAAFLDEQLGEEHRRKRLFYASGHDLEDAVKEALIALGFELQESAPNRSDFVATHSGRVAVFEVKGVTKSAAESHAAQLEKWASDYFLDHNVEAKPVLIVNSWIGIEPGSRCESDFPEQMVRYCERRNHCLITGLQLFSAVADCMTTMGKASQVVDAIFATAGRLSLYDDPSPYLSMLRQDDVAS